jgi:hypothetical protein
MSTHTDRDKIWNAALELRTDSPSEEEGFTVEEVRDFVAGEVSQKDVENTLKTMVSLDYLQKEGGGFHSGKTIYWNAE